MWVLFQERGIYPHGDLDVDEETKYSSVSRDVDEGGYADEDVMLNSYDKHAPQGPAGLAFGRSFADVISGKSSKCVEDGQIQSGSLSKVIYLTLYSCSIGADTFVLYKTGRKQNVLASNRFISFY